MRKMRFGVYRKHSLSRSQIGFSKVAQTRLENRVTRPNEDNVQFRLQDEVKQFGLGATTQALQDKL